MYRFKVQRNLSEDWNNHSHDSLFSNKDFLLQTQHSTPNLDFCFLQIFENENYIGALQIQTVPFKGKELESYLPQSENSFTSKTKQKILDCMLGKIDWSIAVIGNVFITGENGQYFPSTLKSEKIWKILSQAQTFLFENLNPDAILISDIYNEMLEGKAVIEKKGFRSFALEPDMVLDISKNWHSFDDYLEALTSKYRVRTKKVLKVSKALEIRQFTANDIEESIDEIYKLYKNVMDNVDFKMAVVQPEYFINFLKYFPSKFKLYGYYLNNKLVSFNSYFLDGKDMNVHLIGLDYRYNKSHRIYHRMLYDGVKNGIEEKVETVHFGRTATEIKSSVGAKAIDVCAYIKHKSRISNYAFKPLIKYLKPQKYIERNPFKN